MAPGKNSGPGLTTTATRANFWNPCAILLDGCRGPILGGKALGVQPQSEVNSYLFMYNYTHAEPSIGFSLEFPFGQANEEEGFGICHRGRLLHASTRITHTDESIVDHVNHTTVPTDMRRIEVRFPREGFSRFVEPVTDALRSRFPGTKKHLSLVEVRLRDPTLTKVHGFGMPFKNRGHPFDELLNQGGVIAGKYTLLEFLRQDRLQIVVAAASSAVETSWHVNRLPPSTAYPYGKIHNWDTGRYAKMLDENKGPQLAPSWSYHDDNAHLTVMTQSEAQDFMWLDRAADEISSEKSSVYFVESTLGNTSRYYAIMTLSKTLWPKYKHALCRLTKDGSFKLDLYNNWKDEVSSGEWDAKLVDHPEDIEDLNAHPITERDMVLDVRRPLPTQAARGSDFKVIIFSRRQIAKMALKKGVDQ